ncbi:MAG: acetolactate synthase small subunit [Candidatus Bathyarchaeota archaeon]|nr:acetolactate synthase small subunit [Candidatus Bathyarchaeota archaeon]
MSLSVISFLVENKPGVLFNISNNIRRKNFNIHSITAIAGEGEDTTRITITSRGDPKEIDKLVEQMNKMVDIIIVKRLDPLRTIQRDMALVKLHTADPMAQEEALEIINKYKGLILDIKPDTVIAQITGSVNEVNDFTKEVTHIGIIEAARTGITAIEKGWVTLKEP